MATALRLTPIIGGQIFWAERLQGGAVNEWIRKSGAFDGFDAVLRDAAQPTRRLPTYDKGDNLHPNDAGYKAMAASIDLGLLTGE
jgi:lysophospholipase L1-like esterase